LDYLNAGGSPFNIPPRYDPTFNRDLTGDGVAELIFEYWEIYILGCRDGEWSLLMEVPYDFNLWGPSVWLVSDANRNALPELVILVSTLTQAGADFMVFEWDGDSFRSLLAPSGSSPFRPSMWNDVYNSVVVEPSFRDTDEDGDLELVFHSGIPVWEIFGSGLPWREQDDIFEWDGDRYVPFDSLLSTPEYRFQAVQDGDHHTLFSRYDDAIASYQDAIFSDKLDWWSPAKREALREAYFQGLSELVKPTAAIPPPDPDEFPNLAAYSRFRMMLVYALRGWLPELETAYESLQDRYSPEREGGQYTQMARAFMDAFETSGDIAGACDAAIDRANQAPTTALFYISAQHHGWQSEQYKVGDLCPFGSMPRQP